MTKPDLDGSEAAIVAATAAVQSAPLDSFAPDTELRDIKQLPIRPQYSTAPPTHSDHDNPDDHHTVAPMDADQDVREVTDGEVETAINESDETPEHALLPAHSDHHHDSQHAQEVPVEQAVHDETVENSALDDEIHEHDPQQQLEDVETDEQQVEHLQEQREENMHQHHHDVAHDQSQMPHDPAHNSQHIHEQELAHEELHETEHTHDQEPTHKLEPTQDDEHVPEQGQEEGKDQSHVHEQELADTQEHDQMHNVAVVEQQHEHEHQQSHVQDHQELQPRNPHQSQGQHTQQHHELEQQDALQSQEHQPTQIDSESHAQAADQSQLNEHIQHADQGQNSEQPGQHEPIQEHMQGQDHSHGEVQAQDHLPVPPGEAQSKGSPEDVIATAEQVAIEHEQQRRFRILSMQEEQRRYQEHFAQDEERRRADAQRSVSRRGPERYHASGEQLRFLVDAFEEEPNPSASTLNYLSATIGMPMHNLVLWFKNRRARHKKAHPSQAPKNGRRSYVKSGIYSRNRMKNKSAISHQSPIVASPLHSAHVDVQHQMMLPEPVHSVPEVPPIRQNLKTIPLEAANTKRRMEDVPSSMQNFPKRARFSGVKEVIGEDNPCRDWGPQDCHQRCLEFFIKRTGGCPPEQIEAVRRVSSEFFISEIQSGFTLTSAMQPLEMSVGVLDTIMDKAPAEGAPRLSSGSRIMIREYLAQIRSGQAAVVTTGESVADGTEEALPETGNAPVQEVEDVVEQVIDSTTEHPSEAAAEPEQELVTETQSEEVAEPAAEAPIEAQG